MIYLKYPSGVIITKTPKQKELINYKNRGMNLEHDLNLTNDYYREINRAVIYKKPTPIKISKVDYSKNKITEAFFASPSTTDYNGIYRKQYIDFEAKETTHVKSFPLANIHKHQLLHMKKIMEHGGICFLIVRFSRKGETFLLLAKDLFQWLEENDNSTIPYDFFIQKAYRISDGYQPRLDYLKIIDQIYGGAK